METLTELRSTKPWLLHVSTDIVVFAVAEGQLQVLLREHPSAAVPARPLALPGGYVSPVEHLDRSAQVTLARQTGVTDVYLEQLYTFGRPDRHPRSRVITVAYYALVPPDRVAQIGAERHRRVGWFAVPQLSELYLDHAEIVRLARARLVAKLDYSTIAFQLLSKTFTLSELQRIYEAILGGTLDKRNFRKRILAMNYIEDTGEQRRHGSHRPARLYRYKSPGKVHYLK